MNIWIHVYIYTHTNILHSTNNNQWNTKCIEDLNLNYPSIERKQERNPSKCASNKISLAMTQNPAELKICTRNVCIAITKRKISKQMTN